MNFELKNALAGYVRHLQDSDVASVRLSREAQEGLEQLRTAAVRPSPPVLSNAPASVSPVREEMTLPVSGGSRAEQLASLRERASVCVKCQHLAETRTQVVYGVGNPEAELMFIGEAPGADEDAAGEPFVGRAGQLLTKMIQAMGLERSQVYIANVLKCRPDMPKGSSGNRKPTPDEMKTCLPYLTAQIDIIKPRVMVGLGATAVEGLLGAKAPISKLRGNFMEFRGIPLMPTFHPAYLLRNPTLVEKRKVWEDMLKVMEKLGMPISEKQRNFFKG
jgi:uracil-DNA glycosylase family 4